MMSGVWIWMFGIWTFGYGHVPSNCNQSPLIGCNLIGVATGYAVWQDTVDGQIASPP